jgi:modulator of FtsH protease
VRSVEHRRAPGTPAVERLRGEPARRSELPREQRRPDLVEAAHAVEVGGVRPLVEGDLDEGSVRRRLDQRVVGAPVTDGGDPLAAGAVAACKARRGVRSRTDNDPAMDPYRPELWHDFFLATSGASAALAGLLFVAISLHIEAIASDLEYRGISRGSLLGLVNVLVVSLVPLVAQPAGWLGKELVGIGAASIAAGAAYQLAAIRRSGWHVRRSILMRTGFGSLLSIGGIGAGLSIALEVGPGLYIIAFLLVVVLLWSLWDAWVLLMFVANDEIAAERKRP